MACLDIKSFQMKLLLTPSLPRAPTFEGQISEVDQLREGATLISFLYPLQNKKVVEKLASRGTTSFAMDMIPRISRAQTFDALR